jgi:hypothetical protein
MKPMIFIKSCDRDRNNGRNDVVRETWIKTWNNLVDYKFLIGQGAKNPRDDELFIDIPDTYDFMSSKCRAACRWLGGRADYVFIADIDTYIVVPRLLASGYKKHDYLGCICFDPPYAGGGCGYWLSRKCYKMIAANTDKNIPKWDDLWIGRVLREAGVPLSHDLRYWTDAHCHNGILHGGVGAFPYWQDGVWDGGWITAHLGRGTNTFEPKWMKECHELYLRNHPLRLALGPQR